MLHITNGDSVIGTMRKAKLPGEYLSWLDVLHDGPVPSGLTLHEMSDVRARALSEFGAGVHEAIRATFAERDRTLEAFRRHEEVVLWFEHDLFDQLQLLQLLDWFSRHELAQTTLSIIEIGSHPEFTPFYGLGQLNAAQLTPLLPQRKAVTQEQLSAGREVWAAFTSPDPTGLLAIAKQDPAHLPYLSAALLRFLEEYPWTSDGLSRSERQILRAVAAGNTKKTDIYRASSRDEDVPWGDASVYLRMEWLSRGSEPALEAIEPNGYTLTAAGKRLLDGVADWVALAGGVDRWLGGVHVSGTKSEWRWDDAGKKLRHMSD